MTKTLNDMMDEVHKNNVDHGWFDADRSIGDDIALLHTEVSEAYEETRSHGITPYVLDPETRTKHKITTRKYGDLKPLGFPSELADILIRLLDTAKRYDVDLMFEYEAKMAYNRNRPYRHGGKAT